jgi:hypothetical protein
MGDGALPSNSFSPIFRMLPTVYHTAGRASDGHKHSLSYQKNYKFDFASRPVGKYAYRPLGGGSGEA